MDKKEKSDLRSFRFLLFAVTGIDHAQLVRRVRTLKGDKHQHISGIEKTKVSEKCSFLYFLVVLLIVCC